ncbi:recombinase family protein [Oscillospiraceae bacterium HV4-5-C5C]|nr:recombinase family protein [Oscillospiraceae bacterium HV4-5-C5C]
MTRTARTVTVIPPTINPITHLHGLSVRKRRVAGYARVSTDKDEQFTSYEAQIDYYTQYIKRNPEWEFVTVYTDEGLSGLNAKKRDGFNQMVADALVGKIDLIVTKSVSRFARNTVDSLVTVRKLKEKGVEVYFEKENIFTLDSKGELLITIMSSLAQEESRSISENVTWGQRKRFSDGKVSLPYSQFLGYERGQDGIPKIVEEEAALVRRIYALFMDGKTACAIAKQLTSESIPTPAGKEKWSVSTIESILTNEKYKGSAKLQKRFTVDFLTKTMKVNEGEVPQYYVEFSHEPIIHPDEWDAVQEEFARRKTLGRSYSGNNVFASRIICGDCGGFYGPKVWNSTNKYRRTIWQCNAKFKGEHRCTTPHLDEETIKAHFLAAFGTLLDSKEAILENCELVRAKYTDCSTIEAELANLLREIDVVTELTRKCVEENAASAQNQSEYTTRYNGYVEQYSATKARVEALEQERTLRLARADAFDAFIHTVRNMDTIPAEFDDRLWQKTIDNVTVKSNRTLVFKFQNEMEIEG